MFCKSTIPGLLCLLNFVGLFTRDGHWPVKFIVILQALKHSAFSGFSRRLYPWYLYQMVLSVPKFTANLYSICIVQICGILMQRQYRFVVNYGTLSSSVRTYGAIRYFDLLKAFGYIERVVKSETKFRKRSIFFYMCATCSELPSYI